MVHRESGLDEGFLGDILDFGGAQAEAAGEGVDAGVVPIDERGEGLGRSGAGKRERVSVGNRFIRWTGGGNIVESAGDLKRDYR